MTTVYTQASNKTTFLTTSKKIDNNVHQNLNLRLAFFWHKKPFIHSKQKNIKFNWIAKTVFCIDKNLFSYSLKSFRFVRTNFNSMRIQTSYLFVIAFSQKRFLQLSLIINTIYLPFFTLNKKAYTYKRIDEIKKQPLISNFKHL